MLTSHMIVSRFRRKTTYGLIAAGFAGAALLNGGCSTAAPVARRPAITAPSFTYTAQPTTPLDTPSPVRIAQSRFASDGSNFR